MNLYSILVTILLAVIWYKNYKGKKSFKQLRVELSNTHDFYREKYDFYLHFKERYEDLLVKSTEDTNSISYLKNEIKRHLVNIREHEILLQKLNEDEELAKNRITIVKKEREEFTLDPKDLVITKPKRVRKPKVV
jgi:hypothetical protein